MTNKADVITFGCRLNSYETEIIKSHVTKAGLDDVIVFNSCAVTAEAERQLRQAIRKARRENPQHRIVVTGCAAQINPDAFEKMIEVDHVLGNQEKLVFENFQKLSRQLISMATPMDQNTPKVLVGDIMTLEETAGHLIGHVNNGELVKNFDSKSRAFLQIQQGCDHRCTFCIIPFGRGNSRSVDVSTIVAEARLLIDHGIKEIILTGVDLTSYRHENLTLGMMVKKLLESVPDLPRLRLSSLDVAEIDDDLLDVIQSDPRLMPHLHLSLQAGDDLILKRMKRRHTCAQAIDFCKMIKKMRPDIVLGADFIAGFPTETEEMFQHTLDLVHECDLTFLHVFPFSARAGTPASKMPQLAKSICKERAQRLRSYGDKRRHDFFVEQKNKILDVLIDQENTEFFLGYSQHFAPVRLMKNGQLIKNDKAEIKNITLGDIIKVLVAGHTSTHLEAYLI
ncbi:MAG: tRNA (N(6)-L-threonylcarbamoyladenosine(37)-C(2))-methylthiotransferase MtaB [Alphaproteobacteria bacterium]|nr:tRNA (N(6)-L-threonylcarbamoyladenosine(37)-C(2))-methylthiotransferase MtaB [Alphaproteobacteria bacterium]